MESIELIRRNLDFSTSLVLSRIQEMEEYCFVSATPVHGPHTLWVLGHLAYIECLVIKEYALGGTNSLAPWKELFDGDDVPADRELFPSFHVVLNECVHQRNETVRSLGTLREVDLDELAKGAPQGAENLFGTVRDCYQYVANHWLMHRGTLADARKAAGVGRMWY